MGLQPKRYEYYRKTLGASLQNAAILIRSYQNTLGGQVPQLMQQANRVWELSQRHRLVAGVDEAAAATLISACHEAYQPITQVISSLHVTLAEIAVHVVDFERESHALMEELKQKDGHRACLPEPLADWNLWLSQSLTVLQTQVKYLELHARAIQPLLVQSASVKQFQKDLSLATHYESSFCMGLAQAEYRPELLPVAMAS